LIILKAGEDPMTTTAAQVEVYEMSDISGFDDYAQQVAGWSIGLWFGDFEVSGVDRCYFAFDGDDVVGFQTVDGDGKCTAIEVKADWQGRGVSSALIEESGCYRPDRNENPEFWAAMEEKFGF
jgi:GNAT superfamily N-acetyltransferase